MAGFALPTKNIGHMNDTEREKAIRNLEDVEAGATAKMAEIRAQWEEDKRLAKEQGTSTRTADILLEYADEQDKIIKEFEQEVEQIVQPEKFKMTFKNSWWQYLVAILLFKPIVIVLEIIVLYILASLNLSLNTDLQIDIRNAIYVLSLAIIIFLARHLAYQSWKRRQLKLQGTF